MGEASKLIPSSPPARVIARRYHAYLPGAIYIVITMLLVLGAINGQNNLLFWAFGLAVAGLLVSGILSGAALMGLELRAEVVDAGSAGGRAVLRYTLTNRNRLFPSFALSIEELAGFSRGRHRATWGECLPRPSAFVAHVPPRGSVRVETAVEPFARGPVVFDAVRVSTTFPFGLTLKSVVFSQRRTALVRPWAVSVGNEVLEQAVSAAGRRERPQSSRGLGEEFFALRAYVPGDPSRSIAWRPSARHGSIVVREHTTIAPARVWLVVPREGGALRERVISLAAGLAARAVAIGREVGVVTSSGEVCIAPAAGDRHLVRLRERLALMDHDRGDVPTRPLPAGALWRDAFVSIVEDGLQARAGGSLALPESVVFVRVEDEEIVPAAAWSEQPRRPASSGSMKSGIGSWWRRLIPRWTEA
jgi:uncharacterized protein (DUF58 family)